MKKAINIGPFAIQSYTFTVKIEPDFYEDGTPAYHAFIPSLPGCFSWGLTIEEALTNLQVTARLWLEVLHERGESIPAEAAVSAEPRIAVNVSRS